MISETLTSVILSASITGAGLVIAFYALIARLSDRIFEKRFELLGEKNIEIEQIRRDPDAFLEENLKKTTKRLNELSQETDSMRVFPRYLGSIAAFSFVGFIVAACLSLDWLFSSVEARAAMNDWLTPLVFFVSIVLFGIVGVLGIFDVLGTMKDQFEKLKAKKAEVKGEIKNAPTEARWFELVEEILGTAGVEFQRAPIIKTNGKLLVPDLVIPSLKTPRFLIEIMLRPDADSIYRVSDQYQRFKQRSSAKTILIADFSEKMLTLEVAKVYWDFVIDIRDLEKLKEIVRK